MSSAHIAISGAGAHYYEYSTDLSLPRKQSRCNEIEICLKGDDAKELFYSKKPIHDSILHIVPGYKRNEVLKKEHVSIFFQSSSERRYRIDNCNVFIKDTQIATIHIDSISSRVFAIATLCPKQTGITQLAIENDKVRFRANVEVSDTAIRITDTYFNNSIDTIINK
jgi:hypothetical protein